MAGSVSAHWEGWPIDPRETMTVDSTLSITNAVVEVRCESNLFGTANYDGHVHFQAMDIARAVVGSYAYARGLGLDVIIETVIKPDGIKYNIEEKRPDLADLVSAFGPPSAEGKVDIGRMVPIIFSDPLIPVALNDLVSSLILPQYATINCGRAIEAIRLFITPEGDRKQGWAAMQEKLNLHRDYLSFVTEQSKGPRHGNLKGIGFPEIREAVTRSWTVMNRFLEFKKRGDQHLPLSEFPLLTN